MVVFLIWNASSRKSGFQYQSGYRAENLSYPEKMFGRERKFIPIQLRPSGEAGAVRIQFDPVINTTYGNPEFVVMPYRDDAFKIVEEHLA